MIRIPTTMQVSGTARHQNQKRKPHLQGELFTWLSFYVNTGSLSPPALIIVFKFFRRYADYLFKCRAEIVGIVIPYFLSDLRPILNVVHFNSSHALSILTFVRYSTKDWPVSCLKMELK